MSEEESNEPSSEAAAPVVTDETANFEVSQSDEPVVPESDDAKAEPAAEDKGESAEEGGEQSAAEDSGTDTAAPVGDKKRRSAQKRIDKVTKQREAEKRRAEAAEARILELEGEQTNAKDEGNAAAEEPKQSDFDSYDDYLTALDAFDESGSQQAAQPETKEDVKPETPDDVKSAIGALQDTFDEAREKYADFDSVALSNELPITDEMVKALAECDDAAGVMMHLGNNVKDAALIAGKTPAQQMREIAKLDMGLAKNTPKPIKTTNAPEPISPVGGSDAQQKPIAEMSFAEYEAHANARERKG